MAQVLRGKGSGEVYWMGRNFRVPGQCLGVSRCRGRSGRKIPSMRCRRDAWCSAIPFGILLSFMTPAKLSMLVNISSISAAQWGLPGALNQSHNYNVKFLETNIYLNEVNYRQDKAHLDMCFEEIRIEFLEQEAGETILGKLICRPSC